MADNRPAPFPGPPEIPPPEAGTGLNLYRDPRRVALLTFLADPFYTLWWLWQFFKFAQREKFPRARSFWWLLVPIYGLVILYRELDDLKKASAGIPAAVRFTPGLIIAFLALDNFIGRFYERSNTPSVEIFAYLISSLLAAGATFLGQRAASTYLKSKYPDAPMRGFTWGEIVAAALGAILFALSIAAAVLPPA